MERFLQRREAAPAQNVRADPFGQYGELLQGHRDSTPQGSQRQALGEGIDGIDAREFCKPGLIDHPIGMYDLQGTVEHLRSTGHIALGSDRKQLFDVARLGAEVGQHDIPGLVAGIDQMRRARASGRRRAMPIDGDLQRHDGAGNGVANLGSRAAIDDACRQVKQQIDQPRGFVAPEQIPEQLVLFRADAGQAGHRCKERIEQCRAHQANSDKK